MDGGSIRGGSTLALSASVDHHFVRSPGRIFPSDPQYGAYSSFDLKPNPDPNSDRSDLNIDSNSYSGSRLARSSARVDI
ncbi:hypothetical protein EVAR_12804_1 [Eumeta japonica]|uniref:Uncharacterized protein n=1 Tax=Eumeta variegata TaxID=151549 RepID=A0A4C1UAQ7_EUMVA|nr:hypothetical protein EVAR_12804_1 [Eumeta japonica]